MLIRVWIDQPATQINMHVIIKGTLNCFVNLVGHLTSLWNVKRNQHMAKLESGSSFVLCVFNIWMLFTYFKNYQVAFWLWFGPCCKNWLAFPSACFRLSEIFKTYFKIVCLSFDISVLYFELWGLQTHLWSICLFQNRLDFWSFKAMNRIFACGN